MELLILPLTILVLGGLGTGLYLSDRSGWNATAKRLSKVVRANLEFKKDKDKMLPMLDSDEWTRQFQGKPAELPEAKKKHYIVKTDFYRTHLGDWPRWKCKCGQSEHTPVLNNFGGLPAAIKDAQRDADRHVSQANKQEEIKAQYRAKGITGREW